MSATFLAFIVCMTAIIVGAAVTVWGKSRDIATSSGADQLDRARQIELLSAENAGLKGQVSRLEERIAVLERIATDPAERTARQIEELLPTCRR
jgi:hypothetical protein